VSAASSVELCRPARSATFPAPDRHLDSSMQVRQVLYQITGVLAARLSLIIVEEIAMENDPGQLDVNEAANNARRDAGSSSEGAKRWWWPQWLNRSVIGIAAVAVVAVAGFFVIRWLISAPTEFQPRKDIEVAWGDAIGQFKIEPVFPPEEDLTVGDVFAYVTDEQVFSRFLFVDPKSIDKRTPSVKRSAKIAHVDLREELEKTYAELAVFPAALKFPVKEAPGAGQGASPPPSVGRLFAKGQVLESDLPRAAFARLRGSFSATAAGALTYNEQAQASLGGSSQGTEEFQLGEVSTYGLPGARALKKLHEYCNKDGTKDDCNESTYRRYLWPILGDRVDVKNLDQNGNEVYAVDIRLVIVNRVYLARSIVHRRLTGRSEAGGFFADLFSGGKGGSDPPPQEQPSSQNATTAPTDETLRKQIEDLQKQVLRMQNGGGLSAQRSASDESEFDTGRLDRPVAFGFRYVVYDPSKITIGHP
jgi:hypothetical protein